MNILTEIIESENIDDIFSSPKDYVDESYDRPLIKIWKDSKVLFTVFIGIDDNGSAYLVAEDDETSADYYQEANESLWDTYQHILDDLVRE